MKKLYTAIAAAALALSANAATELYLCGGDFGWDPTNPTVVTPTDGAFKFDVTGPFKMSTAKGDWNAFNAGAKTVSTWNVDGVSTLVAGTDNTTLPTGYADGTWSLSVNADFTELTVVSHPAASTSGAVFYLRGAVSGWGTDADWQFTLVSGDVYSLEIPKAIPAGSAFKVGDKDWGTINYGGVSNIVAGTWVDLTYNASGDCTLAAEAPAGTKFTFNSSTHKLLVGEETGGGDPEDPEDPEDPTMTVSIAGVFNEWSESANSTTTITDNCATIVVNNWAGGEFSVVVNHTYYSNGSTLDEGWNDNIGVGSYGSNMTLPESMKGANITFTVAVNNVTTSGGTVNVKVEAVGGSTPEPTYPENVYIVGDLCNWNPANAIAMTNKGSGEYEYTGAFTGDTNSYFSFITAKGDGSATQWDDIVNQSPRYAPASESYVMTFTDSEASSAVKEYTGSTEYSWGVPVGNYKVTLNLATKMLYVQNTASSISNINVENAAAPAEYYNLQGVRIAEPKGIVIVKQGNQVSKRAF